MNPPIYCITGRKRLKVGNYCQDCNGRHDPQDKGIHPLLTSVRTVAHMLHGDEISSHDAALTLFQLTEQKLPPHPHRGHD